MALNEDQLRAVLSPFCPLRVIAGPGTGKTRTLIARIVYLIKEVKIEPSSILVLTFTHKAAGEIVERLRHEQIHAVWVGTFHSLAAFILRTYTQKDFSILTAFQQKDIITALLSEDEKKTVDCTDLIRDMFHYRTGTYDMSNSLTSMPFDRFAEINDLYLKNLETLHSLDFDGLLIELLSILKGDEFLISILYKRFTHILVDEYQDVSSIQIEILHMLAHRTNNICVVGDPNQSIYSFRDVLPSAMEDFMSLFPNAKSIELQINYRNPVRILKGAEKLISNNESCSCIKFQAEKRKDSDIFYFDANSESDVLEMISFILEQNLGSRGAMHSADMLDKSSIYRNFGDIAFLYRTRAQGHFLAHFLKRNGYPYELSSPDIFWERSIIKNFLSYLEQSILLNYDSSQLFSIWLRARLTHFIQHNKLGNREKDDLYFLANYSFEVIDLCVSDGYIRFIDLIKTSQDADYMTSADRIHLSTIHSAKGLEFPVVIVFGLEEGVFPVKKAGNNEKLLKEERRLLYVGMTRAIEQLYLISMKKRKNKIFEPSRFLKEIGEENLTRIQLPLERKRKIARKKMKEAQMNMF